MHVCHLTCCKSPHGHQQTWTGLQAVTWGLGRRAGSRGFCLVVSSREQLVDKTQRHHPTSRTRETQPGPHLTQLLQAVICPIPTEQGEGMWEDPQCPSVPASLSPMWASDLFKSHWTQNKNVALLSGHRLPKAWPPGTIKIPMKDLDSRISLPNPASAQLPLSVLHGGDTISSASVPSPRPRAHAASGVLAVPTQGVPALSLAYCLKCRMYFPIDTGVRFPG